MGKMFDVTAILKAQEEANRPVFDVYGQEISTNYGVDGIAAVIDHVRNGRTAHYVTDGAWSHYQLVGSLIEFMGAADMLASSYAMSEQSVRTLSALKDIGKLKTLSCVIDNRIETRTAGSLQLLQQVADHLQLLPCHAKVTVLTSDELTVTIIGSANYTENKRLEVGLVTIDPAVACFHSSWILKKLAQHG